MQNINVTREGDTLVIKVDISAAAISNAPFSKTGKSKLVASSHGFQALPCADKLALSMNLSAK